MVLILNLVSLGGVIMASFHNRITYSDGYPNNVELGYLGQYLGSYRVMGYTNGIILLSLSQVLWSRHLMDICEHRS